jgi:methyl-accepting chemotaxis protein
VALGVLSLKSLGDINAGAETVANDVVPSIVLIGDAATEVESYRQAQFRHVTAQTDADTRQAEDALRASRAAADKALATYGREEVSDADDAATHRRVTALWRAYVANTAKLVTLSRAGHDVEARNLLNSQTASFERVAIALARYSAANRAGGDDVSRHNTATFASAKRFTIIAILLAVILAVAIALGRGASSAASARC